MNDNYNELITLLKEYYSMFSNYNIVYDKTVDLNETKELVIEFYNNYFNVHNIYYYPKRISNIKYFSNKQFIEIINLEKISPFDIPITKSNNLGCYTETNKLNLSFLININNQMQKHEQEFSLIKKIIMSKTNISKQSYAHEITHTQHTIFPNETSYLNDEILSIFVELICGDYFNSSNSLFIRINDLYLNLEVNNIYRNKIELLKYIKSTLKAFKLYYLYTNENLSSSRNRIIDDINSVFDNNISLDELLKKHNINDDNYMNSEIIKSIIKR